ncbi:MAG: sulfatase-like hydrolase/transferase [Myxococcales bacterium]|nr:sulfatase-like hydrolase/transferase [Myxococcales bacterium]
MLRPLLVAILVLVGGCCFPETALLGVSRSKPAILLVTIDTTRADRVGAYGYDKGQTKTLDRLAATGTTWMRAYASTPLTIPSQATLFTGQAPPTHGVRNEGDFRLSADAITLAERFGQAGYRTMAFTSSFTTQRRWGLDQGFDLYHDPIVEGNPSQLQWREQRPADEVIDDVLGTLDALPDDAPVFAWVHLFDPHWPYDPPEPYASELDDPYDGEIAFADAQLARLIDAWDERYWADASYVVVTAPQGESLGQGGEATHGFLLHDGSIRVPLIIRGPGFAAGQQLSDVVSHVDIAPTLLELAGIGAHRGMDGSDLRYGGSGFAYSESLAGQYSLGLAPIYAYTNDEGRYVEGAWGSYGAMVGHEIRRTEKLQDGHRKDRRLHRYQRSLGEQLAPEVSLDPQALAMLSAMGYLGAGDPAAKAGTVDPRSVIDAIPLTWRARERIGAGLLLHAQGLANELDRSLPDAFGVKLIHAQIDHRSGRLEDARTGFFELYQRAPSSTLALQLAGIGIARGDWVDAGYWYDEAFAQQPSPEAMAGQARVARLRGDIQLAEDRAAEFLVRYPDHPELALVRAELLLEDRQLEAALDEALFGLKGAPWSPWAHMTLGEVFWELGRPDDAIEEMKEALRRDPWQAPVRMRLTTALVDMWRAYEAVRVIGPLAKNAPDDPEIQELFQLARNSITAGQRHQIRRDRARWIRQNRFRR